MSETGVVDLSFVWIKFLVSLFGEIVCARQDTLIRFSRDSNESTKVFSTFGK